MAVEIIMPKLGLTMETGTIVLWRKKEGEPVTEGEVLLEVETDKATVEVPASSSGILSGVKVGTDEPVPVGTVIAYLTAAGESVPTGNGSAVSASDEAAGGPTTEETSSAPAKASTSADGSDRIRATPAARRVAREFSIDLSAVQGTGPEGRIKERDVVAFQATAPRSKPVTPLAKKAAEQVGVDLRQVEGTGPSGRVLRADVLKVASQAAPAAAVTPVKVATGFSVVSPSKRVALNNIRSTTARRMVESVQTAPHFALSVEVDMSEVIRMRERLMESVVKKTGKRLTYTAILIRCVSEVLRQHPDVNASYIDGAIEQYEEVNVGVAMALENGLMVPVIRNADRKSLADITAAMADLEARAKQMKFRPEELSGGTFTISNLGMFGITEFTAIINPPESAILAVGQTEERPVVRDGQVVVRPIMKLTLSIDHRVMDGATGAKFLRDIKQTLENPYLLV